MAPFSIQEKGSKESVIISVTAGSHTPESDRGHDKTHRKLKNRHIQLIGIGGSIGTALFVQIGSGLTKGGPGKKPIPGLCHMVHLCIGDQYIMIGAVPVLF
ncbi:hypothetical protein AX17_003733, partial [Amanita inopinata Kibby_2008]